MFRVLRLAAQHWDFWRLYFLTFVITVSCIQYPIQVGTQAFVPGPPTVVVLFEITMLGMLLSTFLGVFLDSYFPNYRPMEYVKEVSDGKIAVFFICPQESKEKFTKAMTALGAEKVEVCGGRTPMRLFKQLVVVFAVLGVLVGALMIFAYDVIKIDWVVFMEIQDSYGAQERTALTCAGAIHSRGRCCLYSRCRRSDQPGASR